jgi:hypothetical protein
MTREFDELALDGHNYPRWAMDVKISLTLRGMYKAVVPLQIDNKNYLLHISIMLYTL